MSDRTDIKVLRNIMCRFQSLWKRCWHTNRDSRQVAEQSTVVRNISKIFVNAAEFSRRQKVSQLLKTASLVSKTATPKVCTKCFRSFATKKKSCAHVRRHVATCWHIMSKCVKKCQSLPKSVKNVQKLPKLRFWGMPFWYLSIPPFWPPKPPFWPPKPPKKGSKTPILAKKGVKNLKNRGVY